MAFTACVWSGYYRELPIEECVALFMKAGFTHTEITIDHVARLLEQGDPQAQGRRVKAYLDSTGFSIPQGHLCFRPGLTHADSPDRLKKELDLFLAMGVENAVIHFNGSEALSPEERVEKRLAVLSQLKSYVKSTDLYLCLENLGSVPETHTVERIHSIIDAVGEENMGICLDTGHLHLVNCRGEAEQSQEAFIRGAGKRLRALHITNNNGKNDVHQMPFSARTGVNWQEVVRALQETGYTGLFNLEILGEREAPMPIRWWKLEFIKKMTDFMLTPEFLQ